MEGKYIYCLIKESKPKKFAISGMEGRAVYTVHDGDIAAVVSDTAMVNDDFMITRDYMITHQNALEEAMRKGYDILPVSFGTVAESTQLIREKLLKARREEFERAFTYIGGKVELNLKVLWNDVKSVFQEIAAENQGIRRAKQASRQRPLGGFQAARIGEIVKNDLDRKRARLAEKILAALTPLAADISEGEILQDAMIVNTTFLVPKRQGKIYDTCILDLARFYGDKMNFMSCGPLPPYNFVSIRVSFKD